MVKVLHMPNFHVSILLVLTILMHAVKADDNDESVNRNPLSMTTQIDVGQIVKGRGQQPQAGDISGQFLQRTSVWLTQKTVVREKLHLKIGVGGIFWYAIPEAQAGQLAAHKLLTKFGPGISQAQATYLFGEPAKPSASLQMGLFPYKYNPDSKNLGEYLLRSGTYPGVLTTGGWNLLSSANYMMQGLRLNVSLWDGKLQSDFLLPMERNLPPLYDLSPTYIASFTPVQGIEFGAGASWNHGIPVTPSRTFPKDPGFILEKNPGSAFFVEIPNPDTAVYGPLPIILIRDTTQFYTFQGVKLMGRFSFDPKAFMGSGLLHPQDLKMYAEAAVLGVKDYPVLYDNIWERIPIMFGINLPAFGFLDVLGFEMEYYGSKFPNNFFQVYNNRLPLPHWSEDWSALDTVTNYDPNASNIRRDNWKWSLYAKKRIIGGIHIFAQTASDHMRPVEYNLQPFWSPATNRNGKDYYYLFRIEIGI